MRSTIIGIDCATRDKNVGLALAHFEDGRVEVLDARAGTTQGSVLDAIGGWIAQGNSTLIAMDAPLGWPEKLGEELTKHEAGQGISVEPNRLFRRRTDVFVKEAVDRQSLDVGADRIARTAHRALELLTQFRKKAQLPIPLAWDAEKLDGRVCVIEVYPAATLAALRIPARSYKDSGGEEARRRIIGTLERRLSLPPNKEMLIGDADILDAVVCVLAGADFLRGDAQGPQTQDLARARKEGWIWCRKLSPDAQ